jgi:hypothetical protein
MIVCLAATGCGLSDSYNDKARTAPAAELDASRADAHAHDEWGVPLDDDRLATEPDVSPSASPQEAARRYALASNNWTWRNYAAQYRQMKDLAGGRLLAQLRTSPVGEDDIEALSQARLTNRAEIAGVTSPQAVGNGERRLIVVTLERSGSHGAEEARPHHAAYDARLRQYGGGWLVTGWESMP